MMGLINRLKISCRSNRNKIARRHLGKPPLERGDIIDKAMGNNLGHNFPTIDKVENGVVTSVKSRDLGAKTYQMVINWKGNCQGH